MQVGMGPFIRFKLVSRKGLEWFFMSGYCFVKWVLAIVLILLLDTVCEECWELLLRGS